MPRYIDAIEAVHDILDLKVDPLVISGRRTMEEVIELAAQMVQGQITVPVVSTSAVVRTLEDEGGLDWAAEMLAKIARREAQGD